jgi:hypothetical protein
MGDFDKWWESEGKHDGSVPYPNKDCAMAAWEAATKVEREKCYKHIEELRARFEQLEAAAFKLAAGQCPIKGMLVGDEGGNQYCKMESTLEAAMRSIDGLITVVRMPNIEHVADAHNAAVAYLRDIRCRVEE